MLGIMAERIRLIIDTDEETRLAVKLASLKTGESASQLVNRLIRESLQSELADAKKYVPKPSKKKP